jgi:hypothetical protein
MTLQEAIQAIEKKWDEKDWGLSVSVQKKAGKIEVEYYGWAGGRSMPPYQYNTKTEEQKKNNYTLAQVVEGLTRDVDTSNDPLVQQVAKEIGAQ